MNKIIFSFIVMFVLITIIPLVDAQLNFGVEANQKEVEMKLSNSEIVKVKHVITSHNEPTSLTLFEGTISNLLVTNEEGEEKQFGLVNDGMGNQSLSIFPSNQDTIVEYDLEDVNSIYDNMWTLRTEYDKKFAIIFSEEINLIFINNNVIELKNKDGISVNGGGKVNLQYYANIEKTIKKVQWEENEFDIIITSDAKIKNFNFEQPSKSISFEIDSKNKFVTVTMPEIFLGGPYATFLDDEKIEYSKFIDNEKNVSITVKPKTTGQITIIGTTVIPEFSMFIPLIMGFIIILTVPAMRKFSLR
jgi:predicted DNA binding CopG/RHH family protein